VFIKAFLRHLHNFLPRRGQDEEGVSESEDGATEWSDADGRLGGWEGGRVDTLLLPVLGDAFYVHDL
jgi:hypothetical protein